MEKLNIRKLLCNYHLIIPEIQREYVWGSNLDVLQQFISDINNKEKETNVGFLYSYTAAKDSNEHYLIDGQQRFTTLILLLFVLSRNSVNNRSKFKELLKIDEPRMHFSYRVRPLTEGFLRQLFQSDVENMTDIESAKWFYDDYKKDPTIKSMLEALSFLEKTKEDLNRISFDTICNDVYFWYFDVHETSQGEELYITMNSRGQKLTDSEQIKPRLFRKYRQEVPSQEEDFGKLWDNWEEFFYKNYPDKSQGIEPVNIAMNNFIRTVIEIITCKTVDNIDAIKHSKLINLPDMKKYFNRLVKTMASDLFDDKASTLLDATFYNSPRTTQKVFLLETALAVFDKLDIKQLKLLLRLVKNAYQYGCLKHSPLLKFLQKIEYSNTEIDNIHQYILDLIDKNSPENSIIYNVFFTKGCNDEIVKLEKYGNHIEPIIEAEDRLKYLNGMIHCLYRDDKGEVIWDDFPQKKEYAYKYLADNKTGNKDCCWNNTLVLRNLIREFKDWNMFWDVYYDNSKEAWTKLLTDKKWQPAVHSLLMKKDLLGDDELKTDPGINNTNFTEDKLALRVKKDLVSTSLLSYLNVKEKFKLNWSYNRYILYPYNSKAEWLKYIIANKRNYILNAAFKTHEISFPKNNEGKDQYRIYNSGFFWGWDIYFFYKGYNFKWRFDSNNTIRDVYLLDVNKELALRQKMKTTDDSKLNEEEKYYCFYASEYINDEDAWNELREKMDELIHDVSQITN